MAEPAVYRSLALDSLLQQVGSAQSLHILDLGPARAENIRFWSQYSPRLHIAGFYQDLISCAPPTEEEKDSCEGRIAGLLPARPESGFDLILGWDLFNYLVHDQLDCLIHCLGKLCRPGTLLFLLISTLHQIPVEPTVFRILDRHRMVYENVSAVTRPCPRYQPRDVQLMMTGFEVFASFLLRHGVQEYLFAHR